MDGQTCSFSPEFVDCLILDNVNADSLRSFDIKQSETEICLYHDEHSVHSEFAPMIRLYSLASSLEEAESGKYNNNRNRLFHFYFISGAT